MSAKCTPTVDQVNNSIYALYPQGDVGVKRLVVGGSYDIDSIYNINHLEAGDNFYRTGQPVNLSSADSQVATAPTSGFDVRITSTTSSRINIQYPVVQNATQYLVEWRVRNTNNEFWSFRTANTTPIIWGNITPNTEYEIYVTPLSDNGRSGTRSAPLYARTL